MQILRKIFLNNNFQTFTSVKDLHHLNSVKVHTMNVASTVWIITHNFDCSDIISQTFEENLEGGYDVLFPDEIKHELNQTIISFDQPQKGIVVLLCPRQTGTLDWQLVS